ncbi:hypothetical protein BGZ60DRAFT_533588 [Tricladium varicosporioides]|nr:hypothetical protein BGZ60DRAFT_533588 [Hymenoscyphus varicosporioides]
MLFYAHLPSSISTLLFLFISSGAAQYANLTQSFATLAPKETCVIDAATGQQSWNARIIQVNVATIYYGVDSRVNQTWSKSYSWSGPVIAPRGPTTLKTAQGDTTESSGGKSSLSKSGKTTNTVSYHWSNATDKTLKSTEYQLYQPTTTARQILPSLESFLSSIESKFTLSACNIIWHTSNLTGTGPIRNGGSKPSNSLYSFVKSTSAHLSATTSANQKVQATYLDPDQQNTITTGQDVTTPPAENPPPTTTSTLTPEILPGVVTAILATPTPQPVVSTMTIGTQILTIETPISQPFLVVNSMTLSPGSTVVVNDATLTFGPSGPSVINAPVPTNPGIGGLILSILKPPVPEPTSNVVIDGKTLTPGSTLIASGTTYVLPVGATSVLTLGLPPTVVSGTTTSAPGVIINGQTLIPGSTAVISGVTYSLPSGTVVPVMVTTPPIVPPFQKAKEGPGVILDGKTLTPGGTLVVSSTTYTLPVGKETPIPLPIITPSIVFQKASGSALLIGSQTLTPGGIVVVSSITYTLPTGSTSPQILPPSPTISFQKATSGSGLVIDGKTLVPGSTLGVSGITYSLATGGTVPIPIATDTALLTSIKPSTTGRTNGTIGPAQVTASATRKGLGILCTISGALLGLSVILYF